MSWPWWTAADGLDERRQGRAALFAHNRRIAAEREPWPGGTLETCERLDTEHPGWAVTWLPPSPMPGRERPARWAAIIPDATAYLVSGLGWRRPWVFAATAAELEQRIGDEDARIAAALRDRAAEWMRR